MKNVTITSNSRVNMGQASHVVVVNQPKKFHVLSCFFVIIHALKIYAGEKKF